MLIRFFEAIIWPILWPILGATMIMLCLPVSGCDSSTGGDADGGADTDSDTDTDTDTGPDDFGIGFECETPDDLLDPQSDTYAIVKASGRYNDCEDLGTTKEQGIGELEELVGGEAVISEYGPPDIGRHSGDMFDDPLTEEVESEHHVHITFWDKTEDIGTSHTRQDYGVVFIDADALPVILEEGRNLLELTSEFTYQHAYFEQRIYDDDSWFKQCITAMEAGAPESKLFMCHEGVEDYSIGETISVVGLIHAQSFEESTVNCACYKNDMLQSSCEEYDDLPTEL